MRKREKDRQKEREIGKEAYLVEGVYDACRLSVEHADDPEDGGGYDSTPCEVVEGRRRGRRRRGRRKEEEKKEEKEKKKEKKKGSGSVSFKANREAEREAERQRDRKAGRVCRLRYLLVRT